MGHGGLRLLLFHHLLWKPCSIMNYLNILSDTESRASNSPWPGYQGMAGSGGDVGNSVVNTAWLSLCGNRGPVVPDFLTVEEARHLGFFVFGFSNFFMVITNSLFSVDQTKRMAGQIWPVTTSLQLLV